MKNRISTNNKSKKDARENVLKVTALFYLKEALNKERYEECPQLIKAAKRHDVTQAEIQKVISRHVGRLKKGLGTKASHSNGGRLRF